MVTVMDGENVFEVVGYRQARKDEWFLNHINQCEQWEAAASSEGNYSILRPISGPCTRPERREDHEARKYFGEYSKAILRPAVWLESMREAYRRGQKVGKP